MDLIDCQGLAGHATLGAVQAGFKLVRRASLGRFGDEVVDANRHLVGDGWLQDPGNGSHEWEPVSGALVLGTPPCSGFSLMNRARGLNKRGPDSPINSCMRELVTFAARCTGQDGERGAELIVFESVQQAFTQGRSLMLALRELVEQESGRRYDLTHVLMSGSSVGAAQYRHRYFFVAHRIPFGIQPPEPRRVATTRDAIGDLLDLEITWDAQRYKHPATRYVIEQSLRRPADKVTAHATYSGPEEDLYVELLLDHWLPGEGAERPLGRYVRSGGPLVGRAARWWNETEQRSQIWGGPRRVHPDKPGYVLTGGSLRQLVHWQESRFLTARECSRLMGLPDAWCWPDQRGGRVSAYIGKCCPVQSARWLATWARDAVNGYAGPVGDTIGEREFLHRFTNVYKSWPFGMEDE